MKKYFGLLLAIVLVFQMVAFVSAEEVTTDSWNLTIMHTNDTHAHLEHMAKRFTAVKEIRAEVENSILLDAGDVFSGTLFFTKYLGKADLDFMNQLGYDAMTFGNHEFDKSSVELADFVKDAKFPFVSSNIDFTKDAALKGYVGGDLSDSAENGKIYNAIILDVNGEKVGLIGLTTLETIAIASPSKDLVFNDYVESTKAAKAALEKEGINKIIVLSHLGVDEDRKLAAAVEGLDIIVGGHTHTELKEPEVYGTTAKTLVVQANEYGKFLGRVDVTFNAAGEITAYDGKLLNMQTDEFAEDPAVVAAIKAYEGPIDEMKKEVVGYTSVALEGSRSLVRTQETNLGNLITDSMLAKGKALAGAQIVITNGGGIRASIEQGTITLGDVRTVQPFDNAFVTLEMTGAQILASLEHGVSKVETAAGQFPHVAGLKFKYDSSKAPGSRIVSVVVNTEAGYVDLDPKSTYIVATNAFMAGGGDGYTAMEEAKNAGKINNLFIVDYEVFVEYLAQFKEVSPQVEGRIIDVAKPAPVKEDIVYVVKSGDVLWKIAKTYGYTYQEIAAYNNLKNPHLIFVGQKLLIPTK